MQLHGVSIPPLPPPPPSSAGALEAAKFTLRYVGLLVGSASSGAGLRRRGGAGHALVGPVGPLIRRAQATRARENRTRGAPLNDTINPIHPVGVIYRGPVVIPRWLSLVSSQAGKNTELAGSVRGGVPHAALSLH